MSAHNFHKEKSRGFFSERPWIWIIVAFAALIAGLAYTVVLSVKYGQKEVPLEQHGH